MITGQNDQQESKHLLCRSSEYVNHCKLDAGSSNLYFFTGPNGNSTSIYLRKHCDNLLILAADALMIHCINTRAMVYENFSVLSPVPYLPLVLKLKKKHVHYRYQQSRQQGEIIGFSKLITIIHSMSYGSLSLSSLSAIFQLHVQYVAKGIGACKKSLYNQPKPYFFKKIIVKSFLHRF